MKKLLALVVLLQLGTASASLIAVMDTGTDISHKDIAGKEWVNQGEIAGSYNDNDNDGLIGNVNGWDFTEDSATVFNDKYNYLLTADVVKFYTLYAKYELKTISSTEFAWLKDAVGNNTFMNQVNFIGGYAHGTHCGGISLLNTSKSQVMSLKILPTVYEEVLVADSNKSGDLTPTMTIQELEAAIVKSAIDQVAEMRSMHYMLNLHAVDVVNQSFGIGFEAAAGFIKSEFINSIKREPTNAELAKLITAYFGAYLKYGPSMFEAAPDTLFVIAAGNDSSDNDVLPDYPADIEAPNKIVVAATVGYSSLAEFSNFGAYKVDVAAPGVAILSTAPNQNYLHMSGTSQAAPFVTNVIAEIKNINPRLTAEETKAIVLGTVDVKSWLSGKVATSGIVNKARALKAAELSLRVVIGSAIGGAKLTVPDVATPKSFARRLPGMKLNYKPILPSLLVEAVK